MIEEFLPTTSNGKTIQEKWNLVEPTKALINLGY